MNKKHNKQHFSKKETIELKSRMIKSSIRAEKTISAMLEEISFKLVNDLFIASRRNRTPSSSSLTLSTSCSFFIHPDAKSKLCLMLSMLMLTKQDLAANDNPGPDPIKKISV